ncbi:unnamed protein product, partial [Didymodactylos carnosus]
DLYRNVDTLTPLPSSSPIRTHSLNEFDDPSSLLAPKSTLLSHS